MVLALEHGAIPVPEEIDKLMLAHSWLDPVAAMAVSLRRGPQRVGVLVTAMRHIEEVIRMDERQRWP